MLIFFRSIIILSWTDNIIKKIDFLIVIYHQANFEFFDYYCDKKQTFFTSLE